MKARKKSTRSSTAKSVSKSSNFHQKNAKAIVALLVLLLAFSVLVIFYTYQDNILVGNVFKPFMVLVVVFMAFLASLLFLVNKPQR